MKKILGLLYVCIVFLAMIGMSEAADLQWDYPADYSEITGYTIYFTDGSDNYNLSFLKGDTNVVQDGISIIYGDIDTNLHLAPGVEYTIYITAYNSEGQSGASNSVVYQRDAYIPPTNHLPPVVSSPSSAGGLRIP